MTVDRILRDKRVALSKKVAEKADIMRAIAAIECEIAAYALEDEDLVAAIKLLTATQFIVDETKEAGSCAAAGNATPIYS